MIVLNVVLGIVLTVSVVFMIRNNRTFNFRSKLIEEVVFEGNNWEIKHKIFHNGPSYSKMLLSFKPLKLESFYTPEEIKVLTK